MKIITKILLVALVLLIVAEYVPGIAVEGVYPAIIAAIVLGILNVIVKPILFILTLPINILTLGLFTFIINASLFWFAATFVEGFAVSNFWYALFGSIIVTAVSSFANRYL
ncbi:MAG TPA: phage holin family protein [Candidatus Paceibacterota bacterium]|nr:phage holin family protein [Candidatus Paceibacterota bacterium]